MQLEAEIAVVHANSQKGTTHLIHICKGSRIERFDPIVDSRNEGLSGPRCVNLHATMDLSVCC